MPSIVAPPATPLPADFINAHHAVLSDPAIQFHWSAMPDIKPPAWLQWLDKWFFAPIGHAFAAFFKLFGPAGGLIFWLALGLIVIVLLAVLANYLGAVKFRKPKAAKNEELVDAMQFEAQARRLLAEADALAAQGAFEAAAHLLLLRTFEDIDARRPNQIKPAHTARRMANASIIPNEARARFALIARHVEASLFGGRPLDAARWQECRTAYSGFATAGGWI